MSHSAGGDSASAEAEDRKPAPRPRRIRRGPRHSREAISSKAVSRRTGLRFPRHTDLLTSLEHLIATGCKRKREEERRQEFLQTQEPQFEQEYGFQWTYTDDLDMEAQAESKSNRNNNEGYDDESKAAAASTASSRYQPTKEILTEDIRIYGDVGGIRKDGYAKAAWPRYREKFKWDDSAIMNNSDNNWEIEHGDQIHPLAFAAARLSQSTRPKTKEELETIHGRNLNVSSTDTSLSTDQVPRALLLRCWERAVHSASQTVPVRLDVPAADGNDDDAKTMDEPAKTADKETDISSSALFGGEILGLGEPKNTGPFIGQPSPVKETLYAAQQRETAKTRAATKLLCKCLGISLNAADLPPDLPQLTCPVCTRLFEKADELRQHYFGRPGYKGCFWNKVPEKQSEMLAKVMEMHIKKQVDGFLGLILTGAKDRAVETADGESSNQRRRLLNWQDVLEFAERTMQASQSIEVSQPDPRNGKHPIFETVQQKSGGVPLVLNPTIVENVRRRLVDRYANVPF